MEIATWIEQLREYSHLIEAQLTALEGGDLVRVADFARSRDLLAHQIGAPPNLTGARRGERLLEEANQILAVAYERAELLERRLTERIAEVRTELDTLHGRETAIRRYLEAEGMGEARLDMAIQDDTD